MVVKYSSGKINHYATELNDLSIIGKIGEIPFEFKLICEFQNNEDEDNLALNYIKVPGKKIIGPYGKIMVVSTEYDQPVFACINYIEGLISDCTIYSIYLDFVITAQMVTRESTESIIKRLINNNIDKIIELNNNRMIDFQYLHQYNYPTSEIELSYDVDPKPNEALCKGYEEE